MIIDCSGRVNEDVVIRRRRCELLIANVWKLGEFIPDWLTTLAARNSILRKQSLYEQR